MSEATDPVGDLGFDPATAGVAATIVAVAALQTTWGSFGDIEVLASLGAWTAEEGWHQPWRLLSSLWLHGSADHLFGNLVSLLVFGWPLERAIGWRRWLLLYAASGLGGALLAAVATAPVAMVGASGAIFGLFGAIAALAVRPRGALHGGEVAVLREAVWPLGVAMVLHSFLPGVAWAAHVGGGLVGATLAGSGLLTRGLPPRASPGEHVPPVQWGRAVVGTLVIGALACGCPMISTVLMVGYVVIVFLVARGEPRYFAPDGWTVSLGSLGTAGVLWGALGLAWFVGEPWLPPEGLHWVTLGEGMPRVQVASRSAKVVADGVRFGEPGDDLVVTVDWTGPDEGWSFADRWKRLAEEVGPAMVTIADEGGCPSLTFPTYVLVMGPQVITRIQAVDPDGPVDPVWESPQGCRELPLEARAGARERLGDLEGAARLRHEADPDDVVALIRFLAVTEGCEERVPHLAELVAKEPALAIDATRGALYCEQPEVAGWIDGHLKRTPDDGAAWVLRADVARERGDVRGERKALQRAEKLLEGVDRQVVSDRLKTLR
ncbi:MAG: rhomboid family intramembrane serine protease [Alphaproteobacteria bacterium]|nr:rhomboid family intramembrane serine protease [Alphaproteobacteria bacterium]MCB9697682.1 rhomboid family intramembrane serine protease [Alphaproteobacteria bacterium]